MPIPEHNPDSGYLPAGDHFATLEEIIAAYDHGVRRRKLCEALRRVVEGLRARGVTRICVDGSFTSEKKRPGDVDVWYEAPPGTHPATWGELAPSKRSQLEADFGVDLCAHPMRGGINRTGWNPTPLPDYWRTKNGIEKGLLWITEGEDDQEQPATIDGAGEAGGR